MQLGSQKNVGQVDLFIVWISFIYSVWSRPTRYWLMTDIRWVGNNICSSFIVSSNSNWSTMQAKQMIKHWTCRPIPYLNEFWTMGLVGASTSGSRKRFPLAAQQEIMRAAKKDDQYVSLVYAACRDAFCHGLIYYPFCALASLRN